MAASIGEEGPLSMSDIARFWSRRLHGLNFAEHAICRELSEWHNDQTNLCYPNLNTLMGIFECSRPYLKKILNRLDTWNLVNRVEHFDQAERNRQTSNRYRLNLHRHFPDPAPDGKLEKRKTNDKNPKQVARPYDNRDHAAFNSAHQGKRILRVMHQSLDSLPQKYASLRQGLSEAFIEREKGVCWVCVQAEGYMEDFMEVFTDLSKAARKETHLEFELTPVELYYPRNGRPSRKATPGAFTRLTP